MDQPTLSTDAQRHLARAAIYSFTAAGLSRPSDDCLETLSDRETQESALVAAGRLDMASIVQRVLEAFRSTDGRELTTSYDQLFGIPSEEGTYPVVPYETHYTIGDDIGQQQRRIATLIDLAREIGLQPGERFRERQDHIVTELELMQVLSVQRARAIEEDERTLIGRVHDVEATLLEEHLVGFAPALADDLEASTDDDFYTAIAELLSTMVKRDYEGQVAGRAVPTSAEGET